MRWWCAAHLRRPLRQVMAPRSALFLPSRAHLLPGAHRWHGALSTANTGRRALIDEPAGSGEPRIGAAGRSVSVVHARPFGDRRTAYSVGGLLCVRKRAMGRANRAPRQPRNRSAQPPVIRERCGAAYGPAAEDQFDALYSGSRIDLSDGGIPAGLEALMGNRLAPSFVLPGGFPGDPETDHFDFVQVGWTHLLPQPRPVSALSRCAMGIRWRIVDTSTALNGQSRIELLGGLVSGAPPLANLARPHAPRDRMRHGSPLLCALWGLAIRLSPVEDGKRPSRTTASPLLPA